MNKIKLLILFGGRSGEYEVSLVSAASILKNADRSKYDIVTVGITKDGEWYAFDGDTTSIRDGSWCADPKKLDRAMLSPSVSESALYVFPADGSAAKIFPIDVIFPVMHGANAEDGTLQGLLQISGIPFVGCKCCASAVGMDKAFTKLLLKNFDIPLAKSLIVDIGHFNKNEQADIERCEAIAPYPLFVKPANAGSSVGAAKAKDRDALRAAILEAGAVDSKVLIEEYINGKEVEVAIIGKKQFRASTVGQIIPGSEFYSYDAKYSADSSSDYKIPADILPETAEKIRSYALQICSILGVEGLSRVDFFVSEDESGEKIIFNEINTLPGFTEISMYPKLLMHDGMSYSEIIDRLIAIALGKDDEA